MRIVGVKDLKDKLTYYLKLTRKGDQVIVEEEGKGRGKSSIFVVKWRKL